MKDEAWQPRGLCSLFYLHPSSFILPCSRITGDLDVSSSLRDFRILKLERTRERLSALAADCRRRFAAADDYGRDKECDFVDQTSIEELARHICSAFNQNTLD